MEKPTTFRLPEEIRKDLKMIAELEHLDTSATLRRLLVRVIAEWRKDYAVEQYKKGKFSFGQLAKFAGISVWDVPKLLNENKVPLNYDEEELERELKNIGWKKK
jgi:predicted HTH domain antitoxin